MGHLNSALSSQKVEHLTTKMRRQNSKRHKSVELWAKSVKDFEVFGRISNLLSMYARVPQAMGQFFVKSVPYYGDSPNTRNGARLRYPSVIMAPEGDR